MAHTFGTTSRDLTRRLPEPLADKAADPDSNLAKWADAFHDSLFQEWNDAMDYVWTQWRIDQATGIALRNRTRFWRSLDGGTDTKSRYYLYVELWCRWGIKTVPELRDMLSRIFNQPESAFTIVEATDPDTGAREPTSHYLSLEGSLFDQFGFTTAERSTAAQALEDCIDENMPLGHTFQVRLPSGAAYGTAVYGTDTYG